MRPGGLLVPYPRCLQLVVHGTKAPQPFRPVGLRDGEAVDLLLSRGPDEWVAEGGLAYQESRAVALLGSPIASAENSTHLTPGVVDAVDVVHLAGRD